MKENIFRTHNCNEISLDDVGKKVRISGFVQTIRDFGGLVFLDIRDMYGVTQVVTSGKEEDVDAVCDGKKVHHVEKLGRSKGVTVLLNPGEEPDTKGRDVDIRSLSLQDVFVALCGKEESYE